MVRVASDPARAFPARTPDWPHSVASPWSIRVSSDADAAAQSADLRGGLPRLRPACRRGSARMHFFMLRACPGRFGLRRAEIIALQAIHPHIYQQPRIFGGLDRLGHCEHVEMACN